MKPNLLKTIYCLFFFPAILRELKALSWWKGVLSLIVTTFAVSLLLFSMKMPAQLSTAAEWTQWFGEQIPSIELQEDGTLRMVTTKQIPFSSSHGSFLLIVDELGKELSPELMDAPRGAWITPEKLVYWDSQSGEKYVQPLIRDGKFMDYLPLKSFFVEKDSLTTADYQSWVSSSVLLYFVFTFVGHLVVMGVYLLALVAMHKFIGSPVFYGMPFGKSYGIYSFASIPPMIFAVIYSSLPLDFLDFSSAYLFSLLFYMFFIAGRHLIPREILDVATKGDKK